MIVGIVFLLKRIVLIHVVAKPNLRTFICKKDGAICNFVGKKTLKNELSLIKSNMTD